MGVTHQTVSIYQVDEILQGARRHGLDIAELLTRAGIPPVRLESPLSRVSQAQYAALMHVLRRATRDEFFGLCRHRLPLGSFAQGCRLLIHTRTLGEALRIGFRHYHGVLFDFVARTWVDGDVARIRLFPRAEVDRPLLYAQRVFLFFTFGLASWLVARRVPLLRVEYPGSAPEGVETDRLFQAPVSYGHPHIGLCFESRWLDLPVVQNPPSLVEFLRQAPANLLVKYRDQTSVTERIRRLLRAHLRDELPSLEQVGYALAMTPQTLRRRLSEEGQGYQALKDDLRRDAAIEYLAEPDLTLVDIAERLGFSEASTFHRAFKKWTGMAPGEYRSERRAQPR